MCGIAGVVAGNAPRFSAALDAALDALRHRGPDGRGSFSFPDCLLGATRLAIVDAESGGQPMLSPGGQTAAVFNGAIYGYRDLRREFGGAWSFRTRSDTEVLLALYELHGRAMLARLPGMFAFAVWDEREKTLFAARDRFGEKPFYWARGPEGEIVFASEIRAILATGLVRPEIDRQSLAHFLHRRFVPPDRTIYANVSVLPPAHALTFRDGVVEVSRYWSLPVAGEPLTLDAAVEEFRARFDSAVERQLVADVPIAFFLSGGLDSSTVVAVASRFREGATTIAFAGAGSADAPYAREVSRLYGTRHVELSESGLDIAKGLELVADVFDEPLADSSNLAAWLICRAAREHAKVILSGEGADELLGGYSFWYRTIQQMERWRGRPTAWTALVSIAERVSRRLGPVSPSCAGAAATRRYGSIAGAHSAQRQAFRREEILRFGLPAPPLPDVASLDDVLRDDVNTLLPGEWLVRADRTSMAHGIELRSPFLDVDFASFCVSLPVRLKLRDNTEKWILRRAYADSWPESVRRRPKQGFQPSQEQWLARPEMKALARRILDDRSHPLWDLVPFAPLRAAAGGRAPRLFTVLTLGLWTERHSGAVGSRQ